MKIIFYKNNSPKKKVVKSLTNSKEFEGELLDDCDLVNPSFRISIKNPSEYNYFYIPAFHRYYYITEATVLQTGIWKISGHTDVLMSSKTNLLNNKAVIEKTEKGGSSYIDDGSWLTRTDSYIQATAMSGQIGNFNTFLLISGQPVSN